MDCTVEESSGSAVRIKLDRIAKEDLNHCPHDPIWMRRTASNVDGGLASNGLDPFNPGWIRGCSRNSSPSSTCSNTKYLGRTGRKVFHNLLESDVLSIIVPSPARISKKLCRNASLYS